MVVISVREYKNAEAYDHLWGLCGGGLLVCGVVELSLTARSKVSWNS